MLKAVNLQKTYYTEKKLSQKALDDVSVSFDSTGLVFILGKSGSGKSTLLNILGGLDKMDSGEIEIKGKSSKEFKEDDFDSYRNTYLGFIFQDFNILNDFTVKENINLAYELQHKKADENKLNEILKQVDLLEYKDRKPNELSGGQIQRVAIARALIKSPEIIMADEPTGSLDSETGKQVFEILKKLSNEKLVIIVSHDRDSAEEYADRIIELKDGKIISDKTKEVKYDKIEEDTNIKIVDKKLILKHGATLTSKDIMLINEAMQNENTQLEVTSKNDAKTFYEHAHIHFVDSKKVKTKKQNDFKPFELIKSNLPTYNAFKMGKSGLKHKKVKLFFTLFLTIIALTLFGLSDLMGSFNVGQVSANSFKGTDYTILPFVKQEYMEKYNYDFDLKPTQEHITAFKEEFEKEAYMGYEYNVRLNDILKNEVPSYNGYYMYRVQGIIEFPDENAIKDDFVGEFPENYNQIVVNNFILEHFKDFGLKHWNTETYSYEYLENITNFNDVENKWLRFYQYGSGYTNLQIVGMVNYDLEGFEELKEEWSQVTQDTPYQETRKIKDYNVNHYNYLSRFIVKEGFNEANYINVLKEKHIDISSLPVEKNATHEVRVELTNLTPPPDVTGEIEIYNYLNKSRINLNKLTNLTTYNSFEYYFGKDVALPTELGTNEVIVPVTWYMEYGEYEYYDENLDEMVTTYGYDPAVLDNYLNTNIMMRLYIDDFDHDLTYYEIEQELTVVGFYILDSYIYNSRIITSDYHFNNLFSYVSNADFMYTYLNNNSSDTNLFLNMEENNYAHYTSLSQEIYNIYYMFDVMKQIFFYISLVLGVFVVFMILNFISTSISYKKKEIGILRALGARKFDVFKVFYFEGLIMGVINYIITMVLMSIGIIIFNSYVQTSMNTSVVAVALGIRSIVLVAIICFGVIFISSYFPVNKIASKKPIDAIRNR